MDHAARPDVIAACAVSVACGWNLTSVGAIAGPLARHYDASLGAIGLLGSGLWLSHALVQAPAGLAADRLGVRRVALSAMALLLVLNVAALAATSIPALGVVRTLTGLGCGATMVAASLRAQPAGAVGQGAIGGAVSAGAALAVALSPLLERAIGWCAPYAGGAVLAAGGLAFAASATGPAVHRRVSVHARTPFEWRPLLPLAGVLGCTIVLSFSLGNWITTILDQTGEFGPVAAGVAGATVVAGSIVTRPLGGAVIARRPAAADALVIGPLCAAAAGATVLVLVTSPALVLAGMLVVGLAAGLPFAAVVLAALRAVPARPGAAVGFVGTFGTLSGVVAIAVLGPVVDAGAAREAFAALAALALTVAVLYALRARVRPSRPRPATRASAEPARRRPS